MKKTLCTPSWPFIVLALAVLLFLFDMTPIPWYVTRAGPEDGDGVTTAGTCDPNPGCTMPSSNPYSDSCQCTYRTWELAAATGTRLPHFGNACAWPQGAVNCGYTVVDSVGSNCVNSVAVWGPNVDGAYEYGHVAWVTAVSGNQFYVEERNWGDPCADSERWVTWQSGISFITFAGNGTVVVKLDPSWSSVAKGDIFAVDIQIVAGDRPVDGAEIHLYFNQTYLQVVDAAGYPSDAIEVLGALDVVIVNGVDTSTEPARIDFAAGTFGPELPSGTFSLARIHFKALWGTGGTSTPLIFGTDGMYSTYATFEGNSVLGGVENGSVTINGETPPPGTLQNPLPIACGQTATGNTADYPGTISDYGLCGSGFIGPEVAYALPLGQAMNVTITLGTTAPLAAILLASPDSQHCLNMGGAICGDLEAGTYYIVVDGFSPEAYELGVQCQVVETPTPTPTVDLVVSKDGWAPYHQGYSSDHALAGYPITYTLTVGNASQSAASAVLVTDTLPAGVDFVSQSSSYSFARNGNVLVWALGDLPASSQVTIQVVADIQADTLGTIVNQLEASTSSIEQDTTNNSASETTIVEQPVPVLHVSPTGPTLAVTPGGSADLVVTISNLGRAPMTGVAVTPPPHIPWVAINSGGLTRLAPSASAPVTLTANASSAQLAGLYRDLVVVTEASGGSGLVALTVDVVEPRRTLEATVANDQSSNVAGATLNMERQLPSIVVTEGVTQTYYASVQGVSDPNGLVTFQDLPTGAYDYALVATNHAYTAGVLTLVQGTGVQSETLTMAALAQLSVSPETPVMGVRQGETARRTIDILNRGAAPLTGVTVAPPDDLPWVYLGTVEDLTIVAGGSAEFTIFASPPLDQAIGTYQEYVTVTADGGRSTQVALTVEVTGEQARDLQTLAVDAAGNPVTSGSVVLIEQALSIYSSGGITTSFNEQYTAPLDGSGTALFMDLRPGDYNYVVTAGGYEQAAGALTIVLGTGAQPATIELAPSPFTYEWTVLPIDQTYDITLTLTYDAESADAPAVVIPPRYWSLSACGSQSIVDAVEIYNVSPISLTLTSLYLSGVGVSVEVGEYPTSLSPNASVLIPVTVTKTGDWGAGIALVTFDYMAVDDEFVTFTFNPSSLTSPLLQSGQTYTQTYLLQPGAFDPAVLYTLEVVQPASLGWITLALDQMGPMPWGENTQIAAALSIIPPVFLAEGTYTDSATIRVSGEDGSWREGRLVIEVLRTAEGFQVHTAFELGPIPYTVKSGSQSGLIIASEVGCGGGTGGWIWTVIGGGGGLTGYHPGSKGTTPPPFPQAVPPPVNYFDHQQVRLQISQRLMLEGEGFRANLSMDNVSLHPLELVSVDIHLRDLADVDRTDGFTIIPAVPTDLGTVGVAGSTAAEWLILPSGLDVMTPSGESFSVVATIHYTWNGASYSVDTAPEMITVYPAPDLVIAYELSPPDCIATVFDIKTTITNQGQGPARSLRFSSAQPSVVDNQSGLATGFQIVEAYVNGVPQGPSLDLALGDLLAGRSIEIIWRLQSSIPGRFVEFTSDYRQSNYAGLGLAPLISQISTSFNAENCGHGTWSNFYVDDAVTGAVVRKAPGDLLDLVAVVTNYQSFPQHVEVTITIPSAGAWALQNCYWRSDSASAYQPFVTCSDLGGGRYMAVLDAFPANSTRQVGLRFRLPDSAPVQSVLVQAQVAVQGDLPLTDVRTTSMNVVAQAPAVIITNRQKLYDTYDGGEVTNLLTLLTEVADGQGTGEAEAVIYYADWYEPALATWDPSSVDFTNQATANSVPGALANRIDEWTAGIDAYHVLLVGGDAVLPFCRVQNGGFFTETDYAPEVGAGTPEGRAFAADYYFSDAPYADTKNNDWYRGELELSVGRAVGATAGDIGRFVRRGIQGTGTSAHAVAASTAMCCVLPSFSLACVHPHFDFDGVTDAMNSHGLGYNESWIESLNWSAQTMVADANKGDFALFAWGGHANHTTLFGPDEGSCIMTYLVAGGATNPAVGDISITAQAGPLVALGGCHTGVITGNSGNAEDNLTWACIHQGAASVLGSFGYVEAVLPLGDAYGIALYNDVFHSLALKTTQKASIGDAYRQAAVNYGFGIIEEGGDFKAVTEFVLYGVPWMQPWRDLPIPAAASVAAAGPEPSTATGAWRTAGKAPNAQTGSETLAGETTELSAVQDSRLIQFTVSSYQFETIDGYEVLTVPDASLSVQSLKPILPLLESPPLALPPDAVVTGLELVSGHSLALGQHHIPSYVPSVTSDPQYPYTDTTDVLGIYPTTTYGYGVASYPDRLEVVAYLVPAQFDPQTRETILWDSVELALSYETSSPATIAGFSVDKTIHAPGELMTATIQVGNISSTPLSGLVAHLTVVNSFGEVQGGASSGPFSLVPGEMATVVMTLNSPQSGGYFALGAGIFDGANMVVAPASEFIQVVPGEIVSLDASSEVTVGEDIMFQVGFKNLLMTPVQATVRIRIYDATGREVADLIANPEEVGTGTIRTVSILWNTLNSLQGDYVAAATVSTSENTSGPTSRQFVIVRPLTQLSPADGSTVPTGDVAFSWTSVPAASDYELQIDRTNAFTSTDLISTAVSATSHTASLTEGTWYWRVRGLPNGGWTSAWQVQVTATILGDVDGDGLVNSTDALIILSADARLNTSQFCPMNCGDVNGDGLVNSTDALIVLTYNAELPVGGLPVGQPGCLSDVTQPAGCSP